MGDTNIVTGESPISSPGDAKLDALSRSEDATAYIQERQDQAAEDAGQKPARSDDDRQSHIEQALEKAREQTRKAQAESNGLDREYQQAEAEWQQQQAQEQAAQQQYTNQLSLAEARGRCIQKAEQLRQANPQAHKTITDNLMTLESFLDEQQGQALAHALTMYTEAVWNLGLRLTDDSDGKSYYEKVEIIRNATPQEIWEGAVQGSAQLAQEQYVQTRIMQDRVAQNRNRRLTNAPPPFKAPSGGANPPKDIYRAANKGDASDYVRMRRAQMARDAREDR